LDFFFNFNLFSHTTLFSTPNAQRKNPPLAPCVLSQRTTWQKNKTHKKGKGEEDASLSLAFTRRKIFAFFKDHYSYDDFQYGQVPYVGVPFQPNHLRCIIEERWKVS